MMSSVLNFNSTSEYKSLLYVKVVPYFSFKISEGSPKASVTSLLVDLFSVMPLEICITVLLFETNRI